MFKIGDFARIAEVSTHVLRNYDRDGLLHPIHVDQKTGYRYYKLDQLPRLNRIIALKELGLSLEQIKRLLNDRISPDEIHGMLILKEAQIEQQLAEEQMRLTRVRARLRQIQDEGNLPGHEVIVKSVAALPYLSHPPAFLPDDEIMRLYVALFQETQLRNIATHSEGQVLLHGPSDEQNRHHVEIGVQPVEPDLDLQLMVANGFEFGVRMLEPVPQMATLVFAGERRNNYQAYNSIYAWMEYNGYAIAGRVREIYFVAALTDSSPGTVVEFQVPIEPVEQSQFG